MRLLRRLDAGLLAVLALTLPALSALALPALPRGGDLQLHFYRLVALDAALRQGLLYPRWMPDLAFGYGYPLFHFYAPLSTYLGEALHLVGLSFALSVRLVLAASVVGIGLGTYLWARDALRSQRAALVAAVAAVYAPFVLSTPLARGSVSDGVALALLPFAFWALGRLADRPTASRLAIASLTIAGLFLAHNVTAMIACPILLLYAAAGALEARRGWRRLYPLAALAIGLLLSAFFWYPALADKGWTRLDLFTANVEYDYRANFLSLDGLLRAPAPADAGLMNPPGPYHINPLVPLAGLLGLLWAWLRRHAWRLRLTGLWLAGMALLYLSLAPSAWLWERIPLLPVIQFPFRLLGPASIVLALPAAALAAVAVDRRAWAWRAAAALVVLALVVPSAPILYPLRESELPAGATLEDVSRYQSSGALGTTSSGEYLPKTIQQVPRAPAFPGMDLGAGLASKLDRTDLPAGVEIEEARSAPLAAEWRIKAPTAFDATVLTFYFPGWQARLDGRPLDAAPAPASGLMRVAVPAGEHVLALSFGDTPVTRLGDALSALGAVCLLALLVGESRRGRTRPNPEPQAVHPLRSEAALFAALGVCLLVAKVAYLDRVDNPWRHSFDGRHVPGATQAINLDLGGQIRLLAVDPLPAQLAPGSQVRLALYWAALRSPERDYSTSIQIVDDQGNKVAQVDHYRPGGYPTSWWRVGEYNRDEYELEISPTAAPGRYHVLAILYDGDGQRLLPTSGTPGAQWSALLVQQVRVAGTAATASR